MRRPLFLLVYGAVTYAYGELDLLQVDLLASGAILFRPRSGRPSVPYLIFLKV